MPRMPLVSLVAAITAVEGAPVSLASLFTVVPVLLALAISNSVAFVGPRSRLPPNAPEIVGFEIVGLVARTTLPVPVVALPVGVPVIVGLESVGVVMVGLVARPTAPVPVVPLERSAAVAGIPTFSLGKMLIARGMALTPLVDSTNPRICPEPGRVLPASRQSPAVVELIVT